MGVIDGEYKSYYETGELKSTYNYVNGARTGKSFEYYKNGTTMVEANYE